MGFQDRIDIRRKIYLSDQIQAKLTHGAHAMATSCIDLSLDGIGLIFPKDDHIFKLENGMKVSVLIDTPLARSFLLDGTIVNTTKMVIQGRSMERIGVKFSGRLIPSSWAEKKLGKLHEITEFLQPSVSCEDPLFFSEPIFLRLTSLSASGGRFNTSIRNKSIIPGITIEVSIFLQNRGPLTINVTPLSIHMSASKRDNFDIYFEYNNISSFSAQAISEFLLIGCPNLSLRQLRDEGFFVAKMEKSTTVYFPRSQEDMQKLLELRLQAFHASRKMLDKNKPEDMYEKYDHFSRQILCRVGETLVGAARLTYVGNDKEKSEHIDRNFPVPDFILKAGFTELSRMCIHPDYRSGSIFSVLIQHGILLSNQSMYPFVLANCNPELWPLYRRIGAKKIGKPVSAFGRDDCQLIYFKAKNVLFGKDSSFLTWNQLIAPVAEYLERFQIPIERVKLRKILSIHKLVGPVLDWTIRRAAFKKYRTKSKKKS